MIKFLVWSFITLALLVTALFAWARWQERSNLFLPTRDLLLTPEDRDLEFGEVRLASDGLELHGWYIPGPAAATVLWLHGNAGNIGDRVDLAAAMKAELGVSSLLFDYRGYGLSQGRPGETGLYRDAAAAFRWLTREKGVPPSSVVLYGHSMGSAVALDLALGAGTGAGGLVLESPFTSAGGVARWLYNGLPVDLLISVRLDNVGRVRDLAMPVLVIHGEADATIPFSMGREVFEAAPEPKSFLAVPGADHSDCYIVGGQEYWGAWMVLLEQIQDPGAMVQ